MDSTEALVGRRMHAVKHSMECDPTNRLPNPKRLKTLSFNVKNSKGNNILHQFVLDNSAPNKSSNPNYINAVLRSMADVSANALNDDGYSALHLAVLKNNLLMVQKLLSCLVNIDVNTQSKLRMETALHLAAKLGHLSIIEELLNKGADVNMKDKDFSTALFLAVELPVIKLLVSKGADLGVTSVNLYYENILYVASRSGNLANMEFLISSGADINAQNLFGMTALHYVAQEGNSITAEFLISKGADINAIDSFGRTPLHFAASSNNLEMIEFLVDKGADLHVRDESGLTALDCNSFKLTVQKS